MKRIHVETINVNNLSEKKLFTLTYHSHLVQISGKYNVDRWFRDESTGLYFPNLGEKLAHGDCGFEVPDEISKPKRAKRKKKRTPRTERFAPIYRAGERGFYSDTIINIARDIQLETSCILSIQISPEKTLTMKAPVKGDPVYNYNLANKCREDAKRMEEANPWAYFLTITYAQGLCNGNFNNAWLSFPKQRSILMKKLKRKFGVEIQCVIEATKQGLPHAHMILYSKVPLCNEKEPHRTRGVIRKGKLYRYIQKNTVSPIFRLEKAVTGKLIGYLAKYISKSTTKDLQEQRTKKGKLTTEARKALMTAFFPCVYGYRSYSTTFTKNAAEKAKAEAHQKDFTNKIMNEVRTFVGLKNIGIIRILEAARRAANLIDFRIKENKFCKGRAFFLRRKPFTPINPKHFGVHKGKIPPAVLAGEAELVPMGCQGCYFMEKMRDLGEKIANGGQYITTKGFFTEAEFVEYGIQVIQAASRTEDERIRERACKIAENMDEETISRIPPNMTRQEFALASAKREAVKTWHSKTERLAWHIEHAQVTSEGY